MATKQHLRQHEEGVKQNVRSIRRTEVKDGNIEIGEVRGSDVSEERRA